MSIEVVGHRPYTNLVGRKRVYYDELDLTDVSLWDIARGLAHENRYAGQTFRPYSVLEHSLMCEEHYSIELDGAAPGVRVALLMHDAHEFLCKDMPSPLKVVIPGYRDFERRCENAVWERFSILPAMIVHSALVHEIDLIALNTERTYFDFESEGDWPSYSTYPISPAIGGMLAWTTCEIQRNYTVAMAEMQDVWVQRVMAALNEYKEIV